MIDIFMELPMYIYISTSLYYLTRFHYICLLVFHHSGLLKTCTLKQKKKLNLCHLVKSTINGNGIMDPKCLHNPSQGLFMFPQSMQWLWKSCTSLKSEIIGIYVVSGLKCSTPPPPPRSNEIVIFPNNLYLLKTVFVLFVPVQGTLRREARSSTSATYQTAARSTARLPTWGHTCDGIRGNGLLCVTGCSVASDSHGRTSCNDTEELTQVCTWITWLKQSFLFSLLFQFFVVRTVKSPSDFDLGFVTSLSPLPFKI